MDSSIHIGPVIDALRPLIRDEVTTIIAAPGGILYDTLLMEFINTIQERYNNVFVFSAEDLPGKREHLEARVKAQIYDRVHVIPLILLPGENDLLEEVLKDEDEWWRNLIAEPRTTFAEPLYEIEDIRQLLYERIEGAVSELKNMQ